MSTKELKLILKEAKEHIKNKEYKATIKKCNEVLNKEKDCYMALLLLGAAYQDTDTEEAAKYLRKARTCTTDPTLALQGLLKCSKNVEHAELYGELLRLTPDKFSDLHVKILALSSELDDINPCIQLFEKETKLDNVDRVKSAWNCLSEIYVKAANVNDKWNELFEQTLKNTINDFKTIENSLRFKKYLKLLQKLKKYDQLLERACAMFELFSNDYYSLDHICKIYVENYNNEDFDIKNHLKKDIMDYIKLNLELNPKSTFGLLAQGIVCYQEAQYLEARNILKSVNYIQPNWSLCLSLLIKLNMKLKAFKLAEVLFRQINLVDIEFLECLVSQNDKSTLNEAMDIARRMLEEDSTNETIISLYIRASILNAEYNTAEENLSMLKEPNVKLFTLLSAFYSRCKGNANEGLAILQSSDYEEFDFYMEKGIILYNIGNYSDSLLNLLKALRSQPYNSECFYWLAQIYLKSNDELRAQKCLEKCVNIYPLNHNALVLLSALYKKVEDWDSNLALLQNGMKNADGPNGKWLMIQLGQHYLAQKNYNEAIISFRSAKKFDEDNLVCLEGLADAYLAHGMYMNAVNVYERICTLSPGVPYPLLQVASIKNVIGLHLESIKSYESLLSKYPKYVPALKGIAETYAGEADCLHSVQSFGRCREYFQKAVDYLTEAIQLRCDYICLWRLLATILSRVAQLPGKLSHLSMIRSITGNDTEKVLFQKEELFEFSTKFYYRALKSNKNDDFLWHELAVNNYISAKETTEENLGKRNDLLNLATECAKYAIKLSPSKWQHWNLLGVISASKGVNNVALAQHCFIKSVTIDRKCAVAWSNLGILYLTQGELGLANKALSQSQTTRPEFQNAWIGQAQIAELIGDNEAMDLFRHCTQLGFNLVSSIGYANCICSLVNQSEKKNQEIYRYHIEKMYGIEVSLDNMIWYCTVEDERASFEALTLLGYLYSKQDLHSKAVSILEKALQKIEIGEKRDKILCDVGYCLMKSSKPEEAIKYYDQIQVHTFKTTVDRAMAYFKASKYQESYAFYESALSLATADDEKAQVLVAMSAMVYAFQGENDAKSILLQCLGIPNPPVEALMATCALALLHKDNESAQFAANELSKYESDSEYGHHAIYLITQFYLSISEKNKALNYLLGKVFCYPDKPLIRRILAKFLLKNNRDSKKHMEFACKMAEGSIVLECSNPDVKQSSVEAAKSMALASVSMTSINEKKCKLLAQKAYRLNPTCKEAQTAFLSCS